MADLKNDWVTGNSYTATAVNDVANAINRTKSGVVFLDEFAGASDDAKLTAALSYAAAQTHIPAIQFPARDINLSTAGRVPFNGMKLIGPSGSGGPAQLELSSAYANHRILLSVGSDASAWFNGAGLTLYDVYVSGLAFQNANNASQFWAQPSGTLYACEFNALTFYGMTHIFGSATVKALCTQVIFSGMWEVIGGNGTQFYIGGSDCCFWVPGYCNFGNGGSVNADTYGVKFETLGKSSVGYLYLTCLGGWSGMLLSGGGTGVSFHGGTYEGLNAGNPTTGTPVTITGGDWSFHGASFSFVTTAAGIINQSGGTVALYSPAYSPAAASPSPLIYQTGGSAVVLAPAGVGGANVPVRWSTGSTVNLPFNALSKNP